MRGAITALLTLIVGLGALGMATVFSVNLLFPSVELAYTVGNIIRALLIGVVVSIVLIIVGYILKVFTGALDAVL